MILRLSLPRPDATWQENSLNITMPYTPIIKRQAQKKLQSLPRPERFRLAEKIGLLGENPDNAELYIKKLEGEPFYRSV